jgi:hypothetical protein
MNIAIGNKINRKIVFLLKRLLRKLVTRNEIEVFGSSEVEIGATYVINLDRQLNIFLIFVIEYPL